MSQRWSPLKLVLSKRISLVIYDTIENYEVIIIAINSKSVSSVFRILNINQSESNVIELLHPYKSFSYADPHLQTQFNHCIALIYCIEDCQSFNFIQKSIDNLSTSPMNHTISILLQMYKEFSTFMLESKSNIYLFYDVFSRESAKEKIINFINYYAFNTKS